MNTEAINRHRIRRVYDRDVAGLLMDMNVANRAMDFELDEGLMRYIASWENDVELWTYSVIKDGEVQDKGFAKIIFGEYLSHYSNEYWFDILNAKLP